MPSIRRYVAWGTSWEILRKREVKGKPALQPIDMRQAYLSLWLAHKFPELSKVALQLIGLHTTACAAKRNWSKWALLFAKNRSRLGCDCATKMIFLKEVLSLTDDDMDELDLS